MRYSPAVAALLVLTAGWFAARAASASPTALTGYLDALSICTDQRAAAEGAGIEYRLALRGNRSVPLRADDAVLETAGGISSLVGRPVTVEGESEGGAVRVRSLTTPGGVIAARPAAQLGARPYLVIRARFADTANSTPAAFGARVPALFGTPARTLEHYFRTISYGQMNLGGSRVLEPVNLPKPLSSYQSGATTNTDQLLQDCVAAVDAQVNFPDYFGIVIATNVNPFARPGLVVEGGRGGWVTRSYDGVFRRWGVAFVGLLDQEIFAHEMLHSLGDTGVLPHSSGPYSTAYDSRWDVMSKLGLGARNAKYGKIAAETISFNRALLGWVPAGSEYIPTPGASKAIKLVNLSNGPLAGAFLLARIPLNTDSSLFYTVELRRRAGLYDIKIPRAGVVIHRVDTRRADRQAQVVDNSANGNPNDGGAVWTQREKFSDPANGVSIFVQSLTATTATVLVTQQL